MSFFVCDINKVNEVVLSSLFFFGLFVSLFDVN